MIGRPLGLESFDAGVARPAQAEPDAVAGGMAEIRLAEYERGYAAGWEDAAAAHEQTAARARTDLADTLRELSFTYHEARAHVLKAIAPLLRAMTDALLPELARATLGASAVALLRAEAEALAGAPVEIRVAPGDGEVVSAALDETAALPARVVEDPALAAGQVRFAFGGEERLLDTAALLASMRNLVADFLDSPPEQRPARHG